MSAIPVITVWIESVKPHPGADRLEIAHLSWLNVVVLKGEFSAGDVAIYFPVDSVLPPWLEQWLFPPDSKIKLRSHRIRAIRIRGIASQGLLIKPSSDLVLLVEQFNPGLARSLTASYTTRPGQNWTEILGVTSYEPRVHIAPEGVRGSLARSSSHEVAKGKVSAARRGTPATPVSRYVRVLAGLLSLLAIALVLGNAPLLSLGVFTWSLATLGLSVRPPSSPAIKRSIGKNSFWVDETIIVGWTVQVREGIGPVLVYDQLPKEMELVLGNNIRLFWKGPGLAEFTHSYSIRCPRRGIYELPPTRWETRHPLELMKPEQGNTEESLRIAVLPRVLAVRRIRNARALAATPYPMADIARMGVATTDFKEIREYVPGDPMRNINWKATARRVTAGGGRPLVNQYEFEGKKAVWLFFDSSEHMGVGSNLRSPLEHGIEAASALGFYYLSRGYYLGAHFSLRPDEFLYPDTGRRQFNRLTQELLTLRTAGEKYDLAGAVHVCQSQLLAYLPRCVILTRLDTSDEFASPALAPSDLLTGVRRLLRYSPSRRSRISVWVIGLSGYNYTPSDRTTAAVGTATRALETRPLVSELRRAGASVLEWDPFRETFTQVLLRQLNRERSRR